MNEPFTRFLLSLCPVYLPTIDIVPRKPVHIIKYIKNREERSPCTRRSSWRPSIRPVNQITVRERRRNSLSLTSDPDQSSTSTASTTMEIISILIIFDGLTMKIDPLRILRGGCTITESLHSKREKSTRPRIVMKINCGFNIGRNQSLFFQNTIQKVHLFNYKWYIQTFNTYTMFFSGFERPMRLY